MKVFAILSLLALAQGGNQQQEGRFLRNNREQLGSLVNILDTPGSRLISNYSKIGNRSGKILMNQKQGCIEEPGEEEHSLKRGSTVITEGLEETAKELSASLGITGGYGPVKASVKSTWSTTESEKINHFTRIDTGYKVVSQKKILKHCWEDEQEIFNQDVMKKIVEKLGKLNELVYPGAANQEKWEKYWRNFRSFTDSFGTHMVSKVYYGARVIRIVQENSTEKMNKKDWSLETEIAVSNGTSSAKVTADYKQKDSKTTRNSIKKENWLLLGIEDNVDNTIDWQKIQEGLHQDNVSNNGKGQIIEEELTPIWLILEKHPDLQNYKKAIKNLANYIQGYNAGQLCKCSDVSSGERGRCQKINGSMYCYVHNIKLWSGEQNEFMPEVDVGPLNGCSALEQKSYFPTGFHLKGQDYLLSDDACVNTRGKSSATCWEHDQCESGYYCGDFYDGEDAENICQPKKRQDEFCPGNDDEKCSFGLQCRLVGTVWNHCAPCYDCADVKEAAVGPLKKLVKATKDLVDRATLGEGAQKKKV